MQDAEKITTDTDVLWSDEWLGNQKPHHDYICDWFQWKLTPGTKILDIGERSPLTNRLEGRNGVYIVNTTGDLDECDWIEKREYDVVIMSHVIEHLFNPLWVLEGIKKVLKPDGKLYIISPVKPYWITPAKCHFHEMDFRNMKRLISRAGFRIIDWDEYSVPIPFRFSLRNWLRRLYKEFSIITLVK